MTCQGCAGVLLFLLGFVLDSVHFCIIDATFLGQVYEHIIARFHGHTFGDLFTKWIHGFLVFLGHEDHATVDAVRDTTGILIVCMLLIHICLQTYRLSSVFVVARSVMSILHIVTGIVGVLMSYITSFVVGSIHPSTDTFLREWYIYMGVSVVIAKSIVYALMADMAERLDWDWHQLSAGAQTRVLVSFGVQGILAKLVLYELRNHSGSLSALSLPCLGVGFMIVFLWYEPLLGEQIQRSVTQSTFQCPKWIWTGLRRCQPHRAPPRS